MTNPTSGQADPGVSQQPLLPSCANGYRRSLYPGREVSVYYDRHPADAWSEHTHEQVQAVAILDHIDCDLRWRTPDHVWHEASSRGPFVWLIPAGTPHALSCPKDSDLVTLFMNRTFVRTIAGREIEEAALVPLAQLASRDMVIGQLSKAFRRLCRGQDQANAIYVESIGTVLGTHLLQTMLGATDGHGRRGGLTPEALRLVMRHIDEHLETPIRLDTLARISGNCRSYFTELFKRSVGLTAHDYVMRRRVARAQELLETTEDKEVDIAGRCGFSDDTMMARWFRRVLDCTPRDIRAQRPK